MRVSHASGRNDQELLMLMLMLYVENRSCSSPSSPRIERYSMYETPGAAQLLILHDEELALIQAGNIRSSSYFKKDQEVLNCSCSRHVRSELDHAPGLKDQELLSEKFYT